MYVHSPNKKYGSKTGVVMFRTDGSTTETPSCNTMNEWAFSLDTKIGEAMYTYAITRGFKEYTYFSSWHRQVYSMVRQRGSLLDYGW